MLQKLYDKEHLHIQTFDQVLTLAKTLEGAKASVFATRERTDGQREMHSHVTRKVKENDKLEYHELSKAHNSVGVGVGEKKRF